MEDVQEFKAEMQRNRAERAKERANRKQKARESRLNTGQYSLDDDTGDTDVPAAGRSNWEERQGEDD